MQARVLEGNEEIKQVVLEEIINANRIIPLELKIETVTRRNSKF